MDTGEPAYCWAARFAGKQEAGNVYTSLQDMVHEERNRCDLSVYRIKITEGWHVIVLGETPPEPLHLRIEAALTHGTLVNLRSTRPDVISYLSDRRARIAPLAPWIEQHYHTDEE